MKSQRGEVGETMQSQMPCKILYVSIIGLPPLYLLYFNVGISKYFSLSEYDNLLQFDTILVAYFCNFSNISMRPNLYGDHTEFENSK